MKNADSGVFDDDAFDEVRHVFAAIRHGLAIRKLPCTDEFPNIEVLRGTDGTSPRAFHAICLGFQLIDLATELEPGIVHRREHEHRFLNALSAAENQLTEFHRFGRNVPDIVERDHYAHCPESRSRIASRPVINW